MTDDLMSSAGDPATPLEELATLAFEHPETRAAIAGNPSTYEDLLAWLSDLDDPAVNQALAARWDRVRVPEAEIPIAAGAVAAPKTRPSEPGDVAPTPQVGVVARVRRFVATVPALLWLAGGIAVVVLIVSAGVGATIQATAQQRLREEQDAFNDRVTAAQDEADALAAPSPEDAEPTAVPEQQLQRTTTTVVVSDNDGFQQTMTITLGPVILGSNTSLMESQWSSVGGSGSNPCIDVNPGNDLSTNYVIDAEVAGFAFGTITIANDQPDFPPRDVTYIFSRNSSSAMGVGFSNGALCDGLGGFPFNPSFDDGASWGPVPIVIAIADVRTPAFPTGDPSAVSGGIKVNLGAATIPLALYEGN
jgi:hypothetical protein